MDGRTNVYGNEGVRIDFCFVETGLLRLALLRLQSFVDIYVNVFFNDLCE